MLVNDDAEVGQLLVDSLGPELDVYVVGTIQQASDLFDVLRWVDLAFLDLELPDGSGDELLERLARWPDAIRVLLASLDSGQVVSGQVVSAPVASGPVAADRPMHKADGSALKNRHLAHLVLGKPPALPVVEVLKSIVLDLPKA